MTASSPIAALVSALEGAAALIADPASGDRDQILTAAGEALADYREAAVAGGVLARIRDACRCEGAYAELANKACADQIDAIAAIVEEARGESGGGLRELAEGIVETYGPLVDEDCEIDGGDAVEYLGALVAEARVVLGLRAAAEGLA